MRFLDELHGAHEGVVDDVVLRRNDGVPAYNLAVVVDDDMQGIGQVVRGDDLLGSTPRQLHLIRLLGLANPPTPTSRWSSAADGSRLAKRHGAVTLSDLAALGVGVDHVRSVLARTLEMAEAGETVTMPQLLDRFEPQRLPLQPWTFRADVFSTADGPAPS